MRERSLVTSTESPLRFAEPCSTEPTRVAKLREQMLSDRDDNVGLV